MRYKHCAAQLTIEPTIWAKPIILQAVTTISILNCINLNRHSIEYKLTAVLLSGTDSISHNYYIVYW